MIIAKRTGKKQLIQLLLSFGAKVQEEIKKSKNKYEVIEYPQLMKVPSTSTIDKQAEINNGLVVPSEKKAKRFVLTILKDGEWLPMTSDEMDAFEAQYPDIAKFWLDPGPSMETLQIPKIPDNVPIYESWDKAAKRLLSCLKKN